MVELCVTKGIKHGASSCKGRNREMLAVDPLEGYCHFLICDRNGKTVITVFSKNARLISKDSAQIGLKPIVDKVKGRIDQKTIEW